MNPVEKYFKDEGEDVMLFVMKWVTALLTKESNLWDPKVAEKLGWKNNFWGIKAKSNSWKLEFVNYDSIQDWVEPIVKNIFDRYKAYKEQFGKIPTNIASLLDNCDYEGDKQWFFVSNKGKDNSTEFKYAYCQPPHWNKVKKIENEIFG